MNVPVLEVRNLVKHFGRVEAVRGIDFAIQPGTCFGLLGPNGAGKTTTIEVIEGILSPTSGEILYKGRPRGRAFREEVGIQLQSTELLVLQTVRETLEVFRNLYRRRAPLEELIHTCQIQDILDKDNARISGGQKQRLLLAMALANDPDLIFLDEPTTGLDPQARRHLWEIVGRIKRLGKTLVLTTHYMEEAEILCDEIAIVDAGRIIAMGSPRDLLATHGDGAVISLGADALKGRMPEAFPWSLRQSEAGLSIHTRDAGETLKALVALGADLDHLSVRSFNLEDLFIALTGRELRP
ncbi:ABC transporter ATP-binding protein [Desulfobotulus sp.]|jgi:ABC-2 type transport system ATP-binding protein|uniref:ABC transporter ATP-binding protein n=1 Tax=Desulfobotulus sp. TaxID=1940337 RepID=UPI002A3683BA|nr:ABC transporter ATP-binding protein [Desulfobotulus sp.]MDY0162918.1 ABC transporter ATP-binding protein [Desulfobotulus sp.]